MNQKKGQPDISKNRKTNNKNNLSMKSEIGSNKKIEQAGEQKSNQDRELKLNQAGEQKSNQDRRTNVGYMLIVLLMCIYATNILPKDIPSIIRDSGEMILIPSLFFILGWQMQKEKLFLKTEQEYLKICFKQYLLPYYIFAIFGLLIQSIDICLELGHFSADNLISDIWSIVLLNGGKMLWIFPVLFITLLSYGWLRKGISYKGCLIIAILLAIVAYFSSGIWKIIDNEIVMNPKKIFLTLSTSIWRSAAMLVWTALGESVGILIEKWNSKKVVLGILGIVSIIGGYFILLLEKDYVIDILKMEYGLLYITYPAILLVSCGIMLFANWLGQFGAVELFGRQWRMFLLTFENFYFISVVFVMGDTVFKITDNNFLTGLTKLVTLLLLETAILLPYEIHICPLMNKNSK